MKVQRLKDGRLRDAGTGKVLKDADLNASQEMSKARMVYAKKMGIPVSETKYLKWVNGKLFYRGKSTGKTVKDLTGK